MDRQNHLISLVAVFLALGIGILIGASMGVNALVLNQISVIEELQNEIQYVKEEAKLYIDQVNRLNQDLNNWEMLEENYFNPFFLKNKLNGLTAKVLCQGNFPAEVKEFLELTNCRYQVLLFTQDVNWDEIMEEDPALLIYDLLLEKIEADKIKESLTFLGNEKKVLTVYEHDPDPVSTLENPAISSEKKIFFVIGTLDPFLANIVENLSGEQEFVFFLSSGEEEPYQEVSGNLFAGRQLKIDNLSGRLKLLELIENL